MKKGGNVKNPCKLCFNTVSNKNGLQCQGACKKWVHFTCLNFTPGKIQDIKAGIIKVNCPCPDCDIANKEEVLHDEGYICDKLKCPARLPPQSCDVPLYPKKLPIPQGMEIQCPEDCPPYPDAPKKAPVQPPPSHPPPSNPPPCHPPPSQPPTCQPLPCPPPFPPPCADETATKGIQFSQPSKKSQTHVQKHSGSQINCASVNDTSPSSPRRTPKEIPRCSPRGTPKVSPKRSPSPRGSPIRVHSPKKPKCSSPKRCCSPRATPPRITPSDPCVTPRCPPKPGPAQKACLPPSSSPKPPCTFHKPQFLPQPGRLPQRSSSPPRCLNKKNRDECSSSACKHTMVNVPEKKLSVSRFYCSSFESTYAIQKHKLPMGSKSECNVSSPEVTRTMLLQAMEQIYSTVGNFSNQFRDLMCRMMEVLEKS